MTPETLVLLFCAAVAALVLAVVVLPFLIARGDDEN